MNVWKNSAPRTAVGIWFVSLLLAGCGGGGNGGAAAPSPVADTMAPTTTIDTQPAPLTPDIVATFTFSASETATFQASLDGAAFTTVVSPLTLTALGAGPHTLTVRARDAAGNADATPATAQWIIALPAVDTTPPTTTIDIFPVPLSPLPMATFAFSSSEMDSTFEASFDGAPFAATTNPLDLSGFTPGQHQLVVRAIDAAGNADPTPASVLWFYQPFGPDTVPPTTSIDVQPAPVSPTTSATFFFSSSESATYEYSLDGGAYLPSPGILELTDLAEGAHQLFVRAIDSAGNPDPTPAAAQWIVSTPAPVTTLTNYPAQITRSTTASFFYGPFEPGGTFEASLDGAPFATVGPSVVYDGLSQGSHTFSVRARNAAGIADATPDSYTWAIDRTPPSARIVFPTTVSYTDAQSISVRGNANDSVGIQSVTVNGVAATSIDGFLNWRATVPVATGDNAIVVSVADSAGNVAGNAASATVTNRGPLVNNMRGIDYDSAGDRLVVADRGQNIIYGYPLADGVPRVISPASAAGAGYFLIADLAVDTPRDRLIVLDGFNNMLLAVDLTTGARTTVAPATSSDADTGMADNSTLALDPSNNRAFVTNPNTTSVIAIDLATGARSVVSSPDVGLGRTLSSTAGITYDDATTPGTPRLLVSQGSLGANGRPDRILAVDIASGTRTDLSSFVDGIGSGPGLDRPTALELDAANNRLLVLDPDGRRIMAVSLINGDRSVVDATAFSAANTNVRGLAFNRAQNRLFVTQYPQKIVDINVATAAHSTFYEVHVGAGTALGDPDGLVVEQRAGTAATLLVSSRSLGEVMRVNLASGARTAVSSSLAHVGFGPDLYDIADITLDTRPAQSGSTGLALVAGAQNALMVFNFNDGTRAAIADLNASVPAVSYPRTLKLDGANSRAYFSDTDPGGEALYSIDLTQQPATRTLVSGASRGAGPALERASNFVLEPADHPARAILADEGPGGMFSIDLATGDRSEFLAPFAADPLPGSSVISASYLDSQFSRILGVRAGTTSALLSIPLSGAAPVVLSGDDPVASTRQGTGPVPYGCMALDVDTTDRVSYLACPWTSSIMAIDLVSGDRVVIAR